MRKTNLSTLVLLFVFIASSCKQQSTEIFNGKDLSNWKFVIENNSVPADEVYSVSDGIITIKGEPLGYMYTKEKYRNYTHEIEYRWAENARNSGIIVRICNRKNGDSERVGYHVKRGEKDKSEVHGV